jgi:hypothetical protein
LHEGLKFVGLPKSRNQFERDYQELFKGFGKPFVGDAGSHIAFIYTALRDTFYKPKFVFIGRSRGMSIPSAVKVGAKEEDVIQANNLAEQLAHHHHGILKVAFEDVFTEPGAKRIWEHCIGEGFDRTRFDILRRVNVQATPQTHEETRAFVESGVAKQLNQP